MEESKEMQFINNDVTVIEACSETKVKVDESEKELPNRGQLLKSMAVVSMGKDGDNWVELVAFSSLEAADVKLVAIEGKDMDSDCMNLDLITMLLMDTLAISLQLPTESSVATAPTTTPASPSLPTPFLAQPQNHPTTDSSKPLSSTLASPVVPSVQNSKTSTVIH
ncbi:unnamed protein product [Ilex paraguariensis]|uniref:Uncharacterized protein n=1 Tax=Ilex paraguariensis TaxID=185542 RepID=A0ABC8URG8_9AQUA